MMTEMSMGSREEMYEVWREGVDGGVFTYGAGDDGGSVMEAVAGGSSSMVTQGGRGDGDPATTVGLA